jgi:hypothetical protein
VAGVAGLIKSAHPTATPADLKNAILNSVAHPRYLSGGWTLTSGRLDAAAAINGSTNNATPLTDGSIAGAVPISFKKTGSLAWPGDINDVYKTRLRQGHRYAAILDVPKKQDFDLYVLAPGAVDLWQLGPCKGHTICPSAVASSFKGKGKDESVVFKARETGTYYFLVTDFVGKGRYTLLVGMP